MKTKVLILIAVLINISFAVFAAENSITVEELKLNEEEVNMMDSLKLTANDEEGMLRISPSDLVKIKLKLEGRSSEQLIFLANQNLDDGVILSGDNIQFIDNQVIAEDGTVNIQFRPRLNQAKGIYNMRAASKNAVMFSRFYKLVGEEIQPVLSDAGDTVKKEDIEITVSGYTNEWKNVSTLYDVSNGIKTEIPADDYSFEKDSGGTNIAALKIRTTAGWATTGAHTLRFIPSDKAYNPITFTVNITAPVSSIRTNFVSSTGMAIPEGLNGTVTVQERAKEHDNIEFTAAAPDGYDITGVEYKTENGENTSVTAGTDKYSFTMPADDVTIIVTVTPKTYILNLDLQGGNYEGSTSITGTVETLLRLPSEKPEKNGFSFADWRTEPAGSGSVVKNEHFDTAGKLLDFFEDSDTKTIYACYAETDSYVIIGIDKENSSVKVIKRKAESAWLIVAAYDSDGKLVKATVKDISDVQTDTTGTDVNLPNAFNNEHTKVKVFIWNSLQDMLPRCYELSK